MYLVMCLKESVSVEVLGIGHTVKLDFNPGMIGCVYVFDTLKNAETFVGDKEYEIIPIKEA